MPSQKTTKQLIDHQINQIYEYKTGEKTPF